MRYTTIRFTVQGRNLEELNANADVILRGLVTDTNAELRRRMDVAPLVMEVSGAFLWWTAEVEVSL